MDYYLWLDGSQRGPYSIDQLRHMWLNGQITKATKVWYDGLSDWTYCGAIEKSILPAPVTNTPAYPPALPAKASDSSAIIVTGVICAIISLLFLPPVFGLIAFICGVIALVRNSIGAGITIIIISILFSIGGMFVGAMIGSGQLSLFGESLPTTIEADNDDE